ncbi:MAG: prepilin-type N-terminal cleavage/methylation domain-containing protein [Candidatus Aminicenantes bacterium]|nr:prepilin-type N-terminal cleavage/methylation domain-containing protein [Candidatus Aminicenantes bacterium]
MRKYVIKISVRKKQELHWLSDSVFFSNRKGDFLQKAFTLVELLLVIGIIAALFGIGIPVYLNQLTRAKNTKAISDIYSMSQQIEEFNMTNGDYPQNLAAIGREKITDPWGNPYAYLKMYFASEKKGGGAPGDARKDRFLVPLNNDYDLYSKGKDGKSAPALTAKVSWDDVVRANNGAFIGEARKY